MNSSLEQKENVKLCTVTLKEKEVQQLQEAIEDLYYFEFVLGEAAFLFFNFLTKKVNHNREEISNEIDIGFIILFSHR